MKQFRIVGLLPQHTANIISITFDTMEQNFKSGEWDAARYNGEVDAYVNWLLREYHGKITIERVDWQQQGGAVQ